MLPGLWRSALSSPVGDMQAGPTRYLSVSELYSTDEVELLLDEIRELEPTSCRGEELQDFEIAGSGCGGVGGAGGRSPVGTERSWDSHAHYRRAPPPDPRPLAPVYCHLAYLLTVRGALTFLAVVCGVGACACAWAGAGGLRLSGGSAEALRLLTLGALSAALLHTALLFAHVSRLDRLLPLNWDLLAGACGAWGAGAQLAGAAIAAAAATTSGVATLANISIVLACAGGLGCAGAALCAALAGCRIAGPSPSLGAPPPAARRSPGGASYRALPSTSKDDPL